ncbi:serine/threonine-protein kinase [Tuwongella immobilis]|uniref:Protein kinase domain-containing protein n=1 Tax=Tuwongella immobilis TaxID=692036 RepID=A0A6C2YMD9_9BACT|nr:serine/threonine-protein kinase [Tuwongella immobilis]VIP02293.1 wd40 repeat-containing protein : WD40 repeat-containing protein OS=Singulisphaera acidiphila (strain ATCC BAA-1392 / DSM 18658 / VKM B-2454 / MOB10) GN=Sinac_7396 PE=3 SV=1: Pkinase [Tuwongella immobilis]VTS00965.1 wd40 repeat-containing protein : WD40 repeat-containing protein OS=Singulisphaera acidiphila (strain ATCC BAA-1392 / DSM 18658 / VKM B-2454 / MOB10) GN=Sinac_7396 PE=3 SV=1: Pkinase [Tuwongella immobilis]
MTSPPSPSDPSEFRALDLRIHAFLTTLASDPAATPEAFLPADAPFAHRVELLHAELQGRLRLGQEFRVEELVARYPVLSELPEILRELIFTEYRQRRRSDPGLELAAYQQRFPQLALSQLPSQWSRPNTATALPPLETIPGLLLLEEAGSGGMGVVYRAVEHSLQRMVALKTLRFVPTERDLKRFRAEAEYLARLQHPHIVRIHQIGEHAGRPYFTMDWIPGGTLAQRLKSGRLDVRHAVALLRSIADAIADAHRLNIVHRDLKPANILMRTNTHPLVSDFGLAKDLSPIAEGMTEPGTPVGTPIYMAPEQLEESGSVGPLADLYALGAILYECLTGQPPITPEEIRNRIRGLPTQRTISPRDIRREIPKDLERITLRCLHPNADRRYPSVADFAEDLRRFEQGLPVMARPILRIERILRWCQRNRTAAASLLVVGMLAVLCTILAGGILLQQWQSRQESEANLTAVMAESAGRERIVGQLNAAVTTADMQRKQAERMSQLSARLIAETGQQRASAGQIAEGCLWLARALETTPDPHSELAHAIRRSLAAWQPLLPETLAVVERSNDSPSDFALPYLPRNAAASPDLRWLAIARKTGVEVFRLQPFRLHRRIELTAAESEGEFALDGWYRPTRNAPLVRDLHASADSQEFLVVTRDSQVRRIAWDSGETLAQWQSARPIRVARYTGTGRDFPIGESPPILCWTSSPNLRREPMVTQSRVAAAMRGDRVDAYTRTGTPLGFTPELVDPPTLAISSNSGSVFAINSAVERRGITLGNWGKSDWVTQSHPGTVQQTVLMNDAGTEAILAFTLASPDENNTLTTELEWWSLNPPKLRHRCRIPGMVIPSQVACDGSRNRLVLHLNRTLMLVDFPSGTVVARRTVAAPAEAVEFWLSNVGQQWLHRSGIDPWAWLGWREAFQFAESLGSPPRNCRESAPNSGEFRMETAEGTQLIEAVAEQGFPVRLLPAMWAVSRTNSANSPWITPIPQADWRNIDQSMRLIRHPDEPWAVRNRIDAPPIGYLWEGRLLLAPTFTRAVQIEGNRFRIVKLPEHQAGPVLRLPREFDKFPPTVTWSADGRRCLILSIAAEQTRLMEGMVCDSETGAIIRRVPETARATIAADGQWVVWEDQRTGNLRRAAIDRPNQPDTPLKRAVTHPIAGPIQITRDGTGCLLHSTSDSTITGEWIDLATGNVRRVLERPNHRLFRLLESELLGIICVEELPSSELLVTLLTDSHREPIRLPNRHAIDRSFQFAQAPIWQLAANGRVLMGRAQSRQIIAWNLDHPGEIPLANRGKLRTFTRDNQFAIVDMNDASGQSLREVIDRITGARIESFPGSSGLIDSPDGRDWLPSSSGIQRFDRATRLPIGPMLRHVAIWQEDEFLQLGQSEFRWQDHASLGLPTIAEPEWSASQWREELEFRTGMELAPDGSLRGLSAAEWQRRAADRGAATDSAPAAAKPPP